MRILAVPNWSFFDPGLCARGVELLSAGLSLHYARGDVDHGRTVTAFSGEADEVFWAMDRLCEVFLPEIDLGSGGGVHPFAGALDVAPFVLLNGDVTALVEGVRQWSKSFRSNWSIPVHLYEMAAFHGKETRLPVLRGQLGPVDQPFDFGVVPHPGWGYSVVGVRPFLLAVNLDFPSSARQEVRLLALRIRKLRESGEARFAGVRALSFDLDSRDVCQLSLNMTLPDQTGFDDICAWVDSHIGTPYSTELIGVIRDVDLPKSTQLSPEPAQIVPTL